jgi:predicted acetyltransferase
MWRHWNEAGHPTTSAALQPRKRRWRRSRWTRHPSVRRGRRPRKRWARRSPRLTARKRDRLPGLQRWIWVEEEGDAGFAGSINLRWMKGHAALPPFVLGHAGYAVVPWQRQRGFATQALAQLLVLARGHGLPFVDLTTDADNLPSQKVITANGGVLVEHFTKPEMYGGKASLRFRITLA